MMNLIEIKIELELIKRVTQRVISEVLIIAFFLSIAYKRHSIKIYLSD